ncbi:MAG: tetratricopeptide repeat protein [Alphaproteobacteria bacterium]|nr:tetratricopeptide repeat protein [Alphaproteobacteria bacterium]
MTDVFEEVEEEVRRDRYQRLWSRWGVWIMGAAAIIVLGVAGWRLYVWNADRQATQVSTDFIAAQKALNDGDLEGAAKTFAALSQNGPTAYRELAQLEAAAIKLEEGELEEALAGFDAVAASARNDIVRDSARLRAAYIFADTGDFAGLQQRLQPLIDAEGPFAYLARELLAVEAWKEGRFDLARETAQPISLAFDVPESLRQRIQILLAVLGPGQSDAAPQADAGDDAPSESGETQARPQGDQE